jgi:hypothetical protein
MTIEELEEQAKAIKEQCSGWSHTRDGSYEAALSACGYYIVLAKLEKEMKQNEIL